MTTLTPAVNSNDNISGSLNAFVELVEYGDYECRYCRLAYPIVKDIQVRLGRGLRFVFRNFPLSHIHPNATMAAVVTEAAARQGKFWEMHDIIFETQKTLEIATLMELTKTIGLDIEQLQYDMKQNVLINKVENDFESGVRSGVNGTPSFFVNGKKFNGNWIANQLLDYLERTVDRAHSLKE